MSLARVLAEVAREREAQDVRWGEQNHPDGTGPDWAMMGVRAPELAAMIRSQLEANLKPRFQVTPRAGEPFESLGGASLEVLREFGGHEIEQLPPIGATWLLIALEEVFEALAESDPAKLRAELVQSAAVHVAWIEAIDRRSVVTR